MICQCQNKHCINLPFLVEQCPLLKIAAKDAARDGFSATMKAVFILLIYYFCFLIVFILHLSDHQAIVQIK